MQIYAVLLSGNLSASAVISISASISTIALGSTTLCFDFDCDPERRAHTPDYYGYVPNNSGSRTVVFFTMFMFTACHVGVRLIGIALLAVVSPMIAAAVLGGDVLFSMLFKLARNDLRYWLPLEGGLSWVVSLVIRIITKLMVDFTVMVQLRRTYEQPSIRIVSVFCLSHLPPLYLVLSSPLLFRPE